MLYEVITLLLKFLKTKDKLEKEGLFELSHKKALPAYPFRLGVVRITSYNVCYTKLLRYFYDWPGSKPEKMVGKHDAAATRPSPAAARGAE